MTEEGMNELSIIALPLEAAKRSGVRYVTLWTNSEDGSLRDIKVFETLHDVASAFKKQIVKTTWKDIENSLDEHKVWKGAFDPSFH